MVSSWSPSHRLLLWRASPSLSHAPCILSFFILRFFFFFVPLDFSANRLFFRRPRPPPLPPVRGPDPPPERGTLKSLCRPLSLCLGAFFPPSSAAARVSPQLPDHTPTFGLSFFGHDAHLSPMPEIDSPLYRQHSLLESACEAPTFSFSLIFPKTLPRLAAIPFLFSSFHSVDPRGYSGSTR